MNCAECYPKMHLVQFSASGKVARGLKSQNNRRRASATGWSSQRIPRVPKYLFTMLLD